MLGAGGWDGTCCPLPSRTHLLAVRGWRSRSLCPLNSFGALSPRKYLSQNRLSHPVAVSAVSPSPPSSRSPPALRSASGRDGGDVTTPRSLMLSQVSGVFLL